MAPSPPLPVLVGTSTAQWDSRPHTPELEEQDPDVECKSSGVDVMLGRAMLGTPAMCHDMCSCTRYAQLPIQGSQGDWTGGTWSLAGHQRMPCHAGHHSVAIAPGTTLFKNPLQKPAGLFSLLVQRASSAVLEWPNYALDGTEVLIMLPSKASTVVCTLSDIVSL